MKHIRSIVVQVITQNDLLRMHRELDSFRRQFVLRGQSDLETSAKKAMEAVADLTSKLHFQIENDIKADTDASS